MDRTADFWDRIADKYSAQPISNQGAYEETLRRTRAHLRPGMSVIEVGCGTGTTALKLADAVGSIRGTDVSSQMIRIAQAKADQQGAANASFDVATVHKAGQDERFDAVLGFNILHLVDDLPGAIRHARSLLDAGGLFITKTPCLSGKPWFRPLIFLMQLVGKAPRPVQYLSPGRLERMIRDAGFEIVETAGLPPKLPSHFIVARAV